jgi:hypothetical protein
MSPRPTTESRDREPRAAAASSSLVATAVARGGDESLPERMHPEDLAEVVARVTGAVTDHLRAAFAELQDAFLRSMADAASLATPADSATTADEGTTVDPNELLKVKQVLAVRPQLSADRLLRERGGLRSHP